MKQVYIDPNKPKEEEQGENFNITRDQESLKRSLKDEKKKLKNMTFGEKLEYIFMYYKLHIIIVIAVLTAIGWSINHALTYDRFVLYGCVFDTTVYNEDRCEEINEYVGLTGHETAALQGGVNTAIDATSGSFFSQLDVYAVAGEMDFVFANEDGINAVCEYGMATDLSEFLPADLYELWKDRITVFSVYDVNTDDTHFDAPVAVEITGTKVQEYFGLADGTNYLMFPNLSGHEEYLQKLCNMLYDIETGAYAY